MRTILAALLAVIFLPFAPRTTLAASIKVPILMYHFVLAFDDGYYEHNFPLPLAGGTLSC